MRECQSSIIAAEVDLGERRSSTRSENLADLALKLLPFSTLLSQVKTYDDILKLDKEIIHLLIKFEEISVDIIEANNEYIDGHTSGHHRDCL